MAEDPLIAATDVVLGLAAREAEWKKLVDRAVAVAEGHRQMAELANAELLALIRKHAAVVDHVVRRTEQVRAWPIDSAMRHAQLEELRLVSEVITKE